MCQVDYHSLCHTVWMQRRLRDHCMHIVRLNEHYRESPLHQWIWLRAARRHNHSMIRAIRALKGQQMEMVLS
jgi:hypothetical protein